MRWSYLLRAREDGATRLTHTWEFTEAGQGYFREKFGDDAPEQVARRTASAHEDMPRTLDTLREIAEREHRGRPRPHVRP